MSNLVSIIIPVYNRADLICETLESIHKQTYKNWECILVDDGSSDDTALQIQKMINKDDRFKLFNRPSHLKKGANNCRNLGLEKSQGDYVIFFDSDDLMTLDHVEVKLEHILSTGNDLAIAQTHHFKHPDATITFKSPRAQYQFDYQEINIFDYYDQTINWLTYDPIYRRNFIKDLKFHPDLKRGQEYYFHMQCLLKKPSSSKIDQVLTLRRMHPNSIKSSFTIDQMIQYETYQKLVIYNSVPDHAKDFKAHVFKDLIRKSVASSTAISVQFAVLKELLKSYLFLSVPYVISCVFNRFGLASYNLTSSIIKKIH